MAESKAMKIDVTEENEMDLITGLLKAAEYKNEMRQTINIKRDGCSLFKFAIRPLSFDEITGCRKKATTFIPNPKGASLPMVEKEVSTEDYMAWQIYTATVAEKNGKKIWDDPALKQGLANAGHMIVTAADIIKTVLIAGELDSVSDAVLDFSGNNTNVVEYAKN